MQRFPTQWFARTSGEGHKLGCIKARESCRFLPFSSHRGTRTDYLFFLLLAFFGGAFFGAAFAAGLAASFGAWCSVLAVFGFPFASGLAAADSESADVAAAAVFAFPLPTSGFLPGTAGRGAAAAALAARPRRGGGGGGGGGGANGFRNFRVSVRERSLPSSSSMNTSRAILGYSGSCGVISSSVISGSGILCCTCRHLVRKFLIFCSTACCFAVTARNNTISGRASDSSCHVREGVAASLPISRLASSLA